MVDEVMDNAMPPIFLIEKTIRFKSAIVACKVFLIINYHIKCLVNNVNLGSQGSQCICMPVMCSRYKLELSMRESSYQLLESSSIDTRAIYFNMNSPLTYLI